MHIPTDTKATVTESTPAPRRAVITTPDDVALLDRVLVMGRAADLWDADMIATLYELRQRMAGAA